MLIKSASTEIPLIVCGYTLQQSMPSFLVEPFFLSYYNSINYIHINIALFLSSIMYKGVTNTNVNIEKQREVCPLDGCG